VNYYKKKEKCKNLGPQVMKKQRRIGQPLVGLDFGPTARYAQRYKALAKV
jgi:hypothetical protein